MLSPVAADHVQRIRNLGPLAGATHRGQSGTPGDGPYTIIELKIENDVVRQAAYQANGCPSSIAAASMVANIAQNRAIALLRLLEARDVILILGGLPEGKESAAERAVLALHNALRVNA